MAEPIITCGQHKTEILNIFCCKCEEVICVHCMIDSHQMHEMKHLFDAREVIQGQLNRILTTEHGNITGKIKEVKDFISKELFDSDTHEKQVCEQIEKSAESEKNQIESKTRDLTENLKKNYATYRQTVQAIVEIVIKTETKISELRKSGNCIADFKWTEQVELYSNIKKSINSLKTMVKIRKNMKPRFVPKNDINDREIIIGFIEIGEKIASNKLSKVISQGIYSDLNTESIPLKQPNTNDTHEESSSDEVRNEYPITIELNSSVKKVVSKLIPISDEDAWIICENKLCKLNNCKVVDTLYTERVDDMAILGDGSLLLLQRETTYIKRLLGKRISNFAYPGTKIPQCLHVMSENNVIILLDHSGNGSEDQLGRKTREVVQVNNHGVVQYAFSFLYDTDAIPNAVTVRNSSDMYIIFHDTYYTPERTRIVRIDLKTKTLDEEIQFTGAIGIDVDSQFICHGLCFESSGKILVSDQNHHSVLLIDNMKYVKSVYFADHGLDSPGALAFFNGILWIVDETKIHKFREVIQGQLNIILITEHGNITGKIKEVKDFISKELFDSDTHEKQVCEQIEKSAESEKNQIESKTRDLTENLKKNYATYRQTVQAIVETVIKTETKISELRKSGNCIADFKWTEQVELYSNIKKSINSLKTMVKIRKNMTPRFVPKNDINDREIIIGFIEIGEKIASNELSKVISQGIYSDLNTESIPLKQPNTNDTHEESSSDEVRNEYPITIELNSSVKKVVSKLIPISDEDAWIICENKLCKLNNCKVVDTLYTERVDDMAILGDGSLLLLQRETTYIKRLLGKRISNFAFPGTKIPQCLHAMSENNVIVLLDHSVSGNDDRLKRKTREVVQLDNHGVVQYAFSFLYDKDAIPNAITVRNSSYLYIIFRDTYYTPERACIVRIDLKTKTLDEEIQFTGAIGIDVDSQFICHGLCFESSGKILVSDQNLHSVLLIDNMKYVKSDYFADHGLDSPGALAFFKGILWIVDETKIHKFRYK